MHMITYTERFILLCSLKFSKQNKIIQTLIFTKPTNLVGGSCWSVSPRPWQWKFYCGGEGREGKWCIWRWKQFGKININSYIFMLFLV